jgi:hypothetical protein
LAYALKDITFIYMMNIFISNSFPYYSRRCKPL